MTRHDTPRIRIRRMRGMRQDQEKQDTTGHDDVVSCFWHETYRVLFLTRTCIVSCFWHELGTRCSVSCFWHDDDMTRYIQFQVPLVAVCQAPLVKSTVSATHCNTVQHSTTHCNTLHHTNSTGSACQVDLCMVLDSVSTLNWQVTACQVNLSSHDISTNVGPWYIYLYV